MERSAGRLGARRRDDEATEMASEGRKRSRGSGREGEGGLRGRKQVVGEHDAEVVYTPKVVVGQAAKGSRDQLRR